MTTYFGITTHSGSFNVWSGPFMETFEGFGQFRDGARQVTVTTYNGDKVVVRFPEGVTLPRSEGNYRQVDQAISEALNAHFDRIGAKTVTG